jgi:hypothetical protein
MDNTVGSLTKLQRSVIIGTLLGDGYLRIVPGRANAFLEINHSITQKEYVDWKYEMLKSVCKSGPIQRKGNGTRIAYRFTTRQNKEFTSLYQTFYQNGKKIIPEILEIDPISLAVWFMDDGSRCRESDVYLNTQQFDVEDQKKLISFLQRMGIDSSLNKDKIYWRIRIKKSSINTFFNIISPHIIPSMNYKIGYNPVETCIEEQFLHAELLPREAVNTPTPF